MSHKVIKHLRLIKLYVSIRQFLATVKHNTLQHSNLNPFACMAKVAG